MAIPQGLKNSLNAIREISSEIYHQYVPIIDDDTDIGKFASPVLQFPEIYNEFASALINRIVYTAVDLKNFNNPLQKLEGAVMPLGYAGQEIYINPAKGRKYNADDFAGILQKYEADIKCQYLLKNMDVQYPVTIIRTKLKEAFVSWDALDMFISGMVQSLYNGMYVDSFRFTKALVSSAFKDNKVQYEVIDAIDSEEDAKSFITKARTYFLNFQTPSSNYNAWAKVGGSGRPITTWSNPEDIVILMKNETRSYVDVNVLASAFNIDRSILLGNIYPVDNFDVYSDDGEKIFDGSAIQAIICDKNWFKIKPIDQFMEEQRNANNRSIQYYLNSIKMYEFSLFANAVVLATSAPTVSATDITFNESTPKVEPEKSIVLSIKTTPFNATGDITFSSATTGVATVEKIDNRHVKVTGVSEGTSIISATDGTKTATITVTVADALIPITDIDAGVASITLDTTETLEFTITPATGNSPITYSSSSEAVFTVEKGDANNKAVLTEVGAGSATLIATTGTVTCLVGVTVSE